MPRGDRTGPQGMGPRTGRAAGFCAGFDAPGYANASPGRGGGRGGGGRGRRNMFYATGLPRWMRFGGGPASIQAAAPDMEKEALMNQVDLLQAELASIKNRLNEIEHGAKA